MIERLLTAQILTDLTFFPVIGIVGPRQVGKTTLARSLMGRLPKPALYLDLELDTDLARLQDAETFLKAHTNECVIIDEVQRMPRLFALLRALVDLQRSPARFIVLGSASPELIRGGAESLAGRIAYHELTPFALPEIEAVATRTEHWLRGGFPESLLAPQTEQAFRWLGQFTQTYIQRDLRELGYDISTATLTRLLTMLAHLHGSVVNYSDLARSLGVSQPTVTRYLDLLEGSFLISRLPPFFKNLGKRLVKSPKLYIRDSGLLHQLARIREYDSLLGNPLVGASWEGYVIEQIRRSAGPDWQFYFYRTHLGAEADLVLVAPNGTLSCLEIKFSNSPVLSKGFYQSATDLEATHRYVIIPEGTAYPKAEGTIVMGLSEFLRTELPGLGRR